MKKILKNIDRAVLIETFYLFYRVYFKFMDLNCVSLLMINWSSLWQYGRHFADDIFKSIFVNDNFFIVINILLKFAPKGPIDNNSALVQTMAWRRIGDKPLSEPVLIRFTDAYVWH